MACVVIDNTHALLFNDGVLEKLTNQKEGIMDRFDNGITEAASKFIADHEPAFRAAGGKTDGLPELTLATMGLARRIIDINRQRPDGIGKEIIGDTLKLLVYKRQAAPIVTEDSLEHDKQIADKRAKFYALRRRCDNAMMIWDSGREEVESKWSRIVIQCTLMEVAECEIMTRVLAYTGRKAHKKLESACVDDPGTYHVYDFLTFWNFWEDVSGAIEFAEKLSKKTGIPLGRFQSDSDDDESIDLSESVGECLDEEQDEDENTEQEEKPKVERKNKGFEKFHAIVLDAIERNGGAGKAKTTLTYKTTLNILKRKKLGRGFTMKKFLINLGCCGYMDNKGLIEKKGKGKS